MKMDLLVYKNRYRHSRGRGRDNGIIQAKAMALIFMPCQVLNEEHLLGWNLKVILIRFTFLLE
jgi:hypothetical protein